MRYACALCLMVRDEHRYVCEWIEYHRALGVQHFYVTDNASAPPLRDLLQPYICRGLVTYRYDTRTRPQYLVYNECLARHGARCRWLGFLDTDEFLVLRAHTDMGAFLRAYRAYGALSVCWYLFGAAQHAHAQPSVLRAYQRRRATACHYKSLVRPACVRLCGVHRVITHAHDTYTVDAARHRVDTACVHCQCTDAVRLHHYITRSAQDFHAKLLRGGGANAQPRDASLLMRLERECTVQDTDACVCAARCFEARGRPHKIASLDGGCEFLRALQRAALPRLRLQRRLTLLV